MYRWAVIAVLIVGSVFIQACGNETETSNGGAESLRLSSLEITISAPDYLSSEELWSGVVRRELRWVPQGGEAQAFPLDSTALARLTIDASGTFHLSGWDVDGNLLVYGAMFFDFAAYSDNSRSKNLVISVERHEYDER